MAQKVANSSVEGASTEKNGGGAPDAPVTEAYVVQEATDASTEGAIKGCNVGGNPDALVLVPRWSRIEPMQARRAQAQRANRAALLMPWVLAPM